VVTITEKLVAAPFTTVTLGALHVAPVGTPVQANVSVPLNPAPGVACIENVAGCPALTEALAPDCAVNVAAAAAVPLMVTDCGEPAALSAITRFVVRTPVASGENITTTLQDAFAASEPIQVFELMEKSAVFTPLSIGAEVKVKAAFPEFVTLIVCGALDSPCVVIPGKFSVPGISVTSGAGGGGATAVPVKETLCGLPAALSVITSAACVTPTLAGA
jgi:hypothetical protein